MVKAHGCTMNPSTGLLMLPADSGKPQIDLQRTPISGLPESEGKFVKRFRWRADFEPLVFASLLALTLVLFTGCANGGRKQDSVAATEPQPYLRISRADSNVVSLEIAVRQFTPARGRGPAIWLSAATHIGETNYFAGLQRHLEAQGLVLFEGVGARDKTLRFDPDEEASIQHTLASALGLVFQLAAIDYNRPHFHNSDVTIVQLQRLLAGHAAGGADDGVRGSGGGQGSEEFQELLGVMDGSSVLGTLLHAGIKLIGSSPKLRAVTKIVLIETLGGMTGDMSAIRGMPPEMQRLLEVIILERNKVVIADLRKALAAAKSARSISVFYGAGHMADLEKRLRSELGYRPKGETWLKAMTVDLRETGLSAVELQAMRAMIQWQLNTMKGE